MNPHANRLRPAQRREQIAELVVTERVIAAQELAARFGVSLMTVHRDLDQLERDGVLRKSRGAATALPSGVFESTVGYRIRVNVTQKRQLARYAMRYVEPGMSIAIDDSTTTLHMLPLLADVAPLKIATNFMEALRRITPSREIGVMALGGDYDEQHDAFLGVMCMAAIESIRVDATFISTSAVCGGFAYHQEQRVVAFKRAMLAIATRRYLLVDHSKLGRTALHRLVPLTEFDVVIVDHETPADVLEELRQHFARIEVAEP